MKDNGCNDFLRIVKLKKKKEYRDGSFGGCKMCSLRSQSGGRNKGKNNQCFEAK